MKINRHSLQVKEIANVIYMIEQQSSKKGLVTVNKEPTLSGQARKPIAQATVRESARSTNVSAVCLSQDVADEFNRQKYPRGCIEKSHL